MPYIKKEFKGKKQGNKISKVDKLSTLSRVVSLSVHELRNPLGTIRLAAYSLKRKIKTKDQEIIKRLDTIDRKIVESEYILHDLSSFFKAQQIKFEENDLNKSIEVALKEIEDVITENEVEIIKKSSLKMPKVAADPYLLVELFRNIFLNAIYVMQDSVVKELKVSTRYRNDLAIIEISCIGQRIAKEILNQLNDLSFSVKHGVGLGLFLAYEIIAQHQGELKARIKKGYGTIFTIKLPIKSQNKGK